MESLISVLNPIFMSFLMGGFLCLLAQLLIDLTKLSPARIMVIFVVSGVALFAFGAWDFLFENFKSGVSIPLLGFGATVGKGVKEAVMSDGFLGIFEGALTASAVGITFALFLALILSLIFKGKPKSM